MSIFSWFGQGKATEPTASGGNHTVQPAVTPEGAAHGFEWEMPTDARKHDALLWPDASIAMETGPLAVVSRSKGWELNTGSGQTAKYLTLKNGMRDAVASGVRFIEKRHVQPLAEASESYYAKLADLAESRGGADRDAGRDFGMDR